jgi:hypothetical protein
MSLIRELEASILAEGAYAKWLTDRRAVDTMWTRGTIVANMGSNSAKKSRTRLEPGVDNVALFSWSCELGIIR